MLNLLGRRTTESTRTPCSPACQQYVMMRAAVCAVCAVYPAPSPGLSVRDFRSMSEIERREMHGDLHQRCGAALWVLCSPVGSREGR